MSELNKTAASQPELPNPAARYRPNLPDRCFLIDRHLEEAPAGRKVALRSKGHSSSLVVDPADNLIKRLESNIEHNTFLSLSADRNVTAIKAQLPRFAFDDTTGTRRWTYLDFLARLADGTRVGVVVKHAHSVRKHNLASQVEHIATQLPEDVADCLSLVTNEDMPAWHISNCRLFHSVRLDPARSETTEIAEYAATLPVPISIAELASGWGGTGNVFRVIVLLIWRGTLDMVSPGRIQPESLVVYRDFQRGAA